MLFIFVVGGHVGTVSVSTSPEPVQQNETSKLDECHQEAAARERGESRGANKREAGHVQKRSRNSPITQNQTANGQGWPPGSRKCRKPKKENQRKAQTASNHTRAVKTKLKTQKLVFNQYIYVYVYIYTYLYNIYISIYVYIYLYIINI